MWASGETLPTVDICPLIRTSTSSVISIGRAGKSEKLRLWGENVLKGLWKGWEEETDIGVTFLFGLHSDLYCRLHSQGQALHWFLPFLFYISTLWSFSFLHFHIVKFFFSSFHCCFVTLQFLDQRMLYICWQDWQLTKTFLFLFFLGGGGGGVGGVFSRRLFS